MRPHIYSWPALRRGRLVHAPSLTLWSFVPVGVTPAPARGSGADGRALEELYIVGAPPSRPPRPRRALTPRRFRTRMFVRWALEPCAHVTRTRPHGTQERTAPSVLRVRYRPRVQLAVEARAMVAWSPRPPVVLPAPIVLPAMPPRVLVSPRYRARVRVVVEARATVAWRPCRPDRLPAPIIPPAPALTYTARGPRYRARTQAAVETYARVRLSNADTRADAQDVQDLLELLARIDL